MNTVGVESHRLYPGGVFARAVVERDADGRLVWVVAVDYQLRSGQTLAGLAERYAALYDDVAVAA